MKNTPWLVVGAGAVGLFWSCKLQSLGYKVHLVYRSDDPGKKITLESLVSEDETQTLPLITEHKIKTLSANKLLKTAPSLGYDKVLVCTKSFDAKNAFESVANHISKSADITCLCNGIGAQEQLQNLIKSNQTLWAGVTSEGLLKVNEHHVKHTGLGDTFFGPWLEENKDKTFPIASLGVTNIHQRIIEKLAVNALINPLTAIFSIHNGDLLNEEYGPLIEATLSELESVFTHENFRYKAKSQHLTAENLKRRIDTIIRLTRLNRSSMHEDLRLNRPTENDFISGFLLDSSPIELPIQNLMYQSIESPKQLEESKKKLLNMV